MGLCSEYACEHYCCGTAESGVKCEHFCPVFFSTESIEAAEPAFCPSAPDILKPQCTELQSKPDVTEKKVIINLCTIVDGGSKLDKKPDRTAEQKDLFKL